MALTPYCEPAEVRATLGVNAIELPDAVLNLTIYQIGLMRELQALSPSLPASFSVINAKPESSRSDTETAVFEAARLFSVYACARLVGPSLGGMMPKDVGDGKASIARFSDSPYKDVREKVEQFYLAARAALVQAIVTFTSSDPVLRAPATMFKAATRLYDPIKG